MNVVRLDSESDSGGGPITLGPPNATTVLWRCQRIAVSGTGRVYVYIGPVTGGNLYAVEPVDVAGRIIRLDSYEMRAGDPAFNLQLSAATTIRAVLWGEQVELARFGVGAWR